MKELFNHVRVWFKLNPELRRTREIRRLWKDGFRHLLGKTRLGKAYYRVERVLNDVKYHVRSHWGRVADVESDYDGWSANHYICFGFVRCDVGHSSYYNGIDGGFSQDDMMLCSERRERIESFWTRCWDRENWSRISWDGYRDLRW